MNFEFGACQLSSQEIKYGCWTLLDTTSALMYSHVCVDVGCGIAAPTARSEIIIS